MSWSKTPCGPPPLLGGANGSKHLGFDGLRDRARANLERIRKGEDMPTPRPTRTPTPTKGRENDLPENKRKKAMDEMERAAESPDNPPPTPTPLGKDGKVGKVMGEFKHGTLHSGSKSGPKVKNKRQAVAIAMSEAGKSKK